MIVIAVRHIDYGVRLVINTDLDLVFIQVITLGDLPEQIELLTLLDLRKAKGICRS